MIASNPQGVANNFIYFCDSTASWVTPTEELKDMFEKILGGFRREVGEENWQSFVKQFPQDLLNKLAASYPIL